jgi:hypothetical protein
MTSETDIVVETLGASNAICSAGGATCGHRRGGNDRRPRKIGRHFVRA